MLARACLLLPTKIMENPHDTIERYLDGQLDPTEQEQFEQALSESPELREQLEAARQWREQLASTELPKPPQAEERTAPARNTWLGGMLVGLAVLAGAYVFFQRFGWGNAPENVFDEAFAPPTSLLEDYRQRHASDSIGMLTPACAEMVAEADDRYRKGDLELAQDPLLMIALDTAASDCRSDAWFFLGILRLKMDDPGTAIQCFTKIEDFERFGDDIQWYMALAFVQVAEKQPDMALQARRAMERVRDSAPSEERRERAAQLLEKM